MKLSKSFIYKDLYKDLTDRYGEEKAAAIWQYAEAEYKRLKAEHPDSERNDLSFVFPPVAFYRAIEQFAPGEALEECRAYGTKTGIRLRDVFRRITALPGIPDLMWSNMDKIGAVMSNGYDVKDLVITDHICSLDVTGCPLYDRAKELGTPEAVQMICCMDKEYMTGFRGVDYTRTKSVAEGDECCDYRLRDCRDSDPETTYRMEISDSRWWAYDIPGNLGWIAYFAGLGRMIKNREYGNAAVCVVPAALMTTGIAELISERITGLDRELPKKRLYRGFGALTLGGLTGIAAGALAGKGTGNKTIMSTGSAMCAVFAGLLFGRYKKK